VKILNGLISGAVAGINILIGAYNAIPFLPNVSKISMPTVSVPAVSTNIPTSASVTSGSTVFGGSTSGGTSSGTVSGGSTGVSTAAKSAAFATAGLAKIPSNFNVGGFRAGEEADRGMTIINVNGAIDKEGTARTIVDTLNNSYYRGTGGAGNLVA
jgi:hypothetical protein